MLMSGYMSGLGAVDNTKPLVNDYEIDEALESLIRSAALKTVKNVKAGLSGLSQANNEREFDRELEADIMQNTLEGLAQSDLEPMTAGEFSRALRDELSSGEMGGFFSSLKKAVKRVVKLPVTLHKKVFKAVKKTAKKLGPIIKKVAPIAAAGAAIYFGGPLVMGAVKKYAPMAMNYGKGLISKVMGGPKAPAVPTQPADAQMMMMQAAQNPEMVDATAKAAQAGLAAQGVQMKSPGAWNFLKGLAKGALKKASTKIPLMMQAAGGAPPPFDPSKIAPQFGPQVPAYRGPVLPGAPGIPGAGLRPAAPAAGGGMMLPLLAAGGAALLLMNR